MKNNLVRFVTVLTLAACAPACAGDAKEPQATPISVATRAATAATQSSVASGITPTAAAPTQSPVPVASPTAAASPSSVAPTAALQPGGGSTAVPQPTSVPRASAVSLTFRAANLAFDQSVVHVPAGATITATLKNDDAGQEHNLTFGLPGLPHGDTCKGPCTATQVFKVGAAGSYSFLCTIHDMFGSFIVDP